MLYYLIVCRSLTYAQALLRRWSGRGSRLISCAPQRHCGEGAALCKAVPARLADALRALHRVGLEPKRSLSPPGTEAIGGGAGIYLDSAATTLQKAAGGGPGQRLGHRPSGQPWPRDTAMAAADAAFCLPGRRPPPSLTCLSRSGWSLPSTPPTD